jgi:dolichol-phosphate mannosyltransferase
MTKSATKKSPKINLAVVSPTYNEVKNIENLLTSLYAVSVQHPDVDFSIIIIDDSSPDGTAVEGRRIAEKLRSKNFNVNVWVRKAKDGLGRAYIYGFKKLLKEMPQVTHVLQMDADLSHDPAYISGFIYQAKNGAEFVVATRYRPGGGTPDWSFYRKLLSRGGNLYTRTILSTKITDYTGGFNLYSRKLLEKLDLDTLRAKGYGFLIELKYRALKASKYTSEIPIVFLDRKHGSSKIPKSTLFKNLVLVPMIKVSKHR